MTNNVLSPLLELFKSQEDIVWIASDDQELSGRDCLLGIALVQSVLRVKNFSPDERVLVFSGRGNQFWIDVMAIWGLGGVAVPIDAAVTQESLDYMVSKSKPVYAIGAPPTLTISCASIERSNQANRTELKESARCLDVDDNANALVLFTSGTTGEPKGVTLTHSAIHGNAIATASCFEMTRVKRLFVPVPFRFVSALSHFMATLYNKVCYMGTEKRFLKTELLAELQKNKCDAFGGSPLQLRWISELAEQYDLNITWMMASGDNLPVQTIEALKAVLPDARIVTAYGLTELAGRFCILPPSKSNDLAGSVGKPIPGLEFQILDDELNPVPTGEAGEIYVKGGYIFAGYMSDDAKTQDVMLEQGFATGDIGYVDEQGYLYLSGRSDDVFKSGGLKVSTLPIAALLMSAGQFEDLAVISQADEVLGHVPAVYYVPKAGVEFAKGPLMKLLRSQLPPGHLPRSFHVISRIPRTGSGKVQRKVLRDLIASEIS